MMRSLIGFVFSIALLISSIGGGDAKTWGPATVANPAVDRTKLVDEIFAELAASPSEGISKVLIKRLWTVWHMAPDEETAELLNKTIRAIGGYNFDKAIGFTDTMIERHPEYVEPWNQRAYAYFLDKQFDKSLAACEKVLELEPRHIGCLSGMARILIRYQQRYRAGSGLIERAVKLHPFLYERVLLQEIPKPFR